MLKKVMIDFKSIKDAKNDINEMEYFLLPYLYLFADEILEPIVCEGAFFPDVELPSFVKPVYIFNDNPPFVCDYAITAYRTGNKDFMGSYFSPSQNFKKKVITVQGVSAYNSVLLLAASGLELQIPGLDFDVTRTEEIEIIREKLAEERIAYVNAINKLTDEAFDRLKSSEYLDTVKWAVDQTTLKVEPLVKDFNRSIKGLENKLLKRIGINFVKEGLPTICNKILEKGVKEGGNAFIATILKTLCTNLFLRAEQRKYPEVVYGYEIQKYRTIEFQQLK